MTTLEKIKNNISVSTNEYVDACKDYLVRKGLVRNEWHFYDLINDNTDWGITRHFHWSIKGADLIVAYLTHNKYQSFRELVRNGN